MEENVTVKSVALKFGVINALIGIISFTLFDFAGLALNELVRWSGLVYSLIIIYLAHQEFKKGNEGFMSYGQGLGLGTLLSLVAGTISSIYTFVYISFINTEFITAIKDKTVMDMEEKGMTDAQIDQAMKFSESFMTPTAMLIMGIISMVFIGFLVSLLIAAFTKKNSPELK